MTDGTHRRIRARALRGHRGIAVLAGGLASVMLIATPLALVAPQVASAAGPTVSVSPTTGAPGTALTVSGGGWTGGDTIFVQVGSSTFDTDVVCILRANLSGVISGNQATNNCVVPRVPFGSQPLVAIDQQHTTSVAHGTNFPVTAGLVLTPAGSVAGAPASPGATVSIQGAGFAAGSTVSSFKFDSTAVTATPSAVSTDINGTFTATVTFAVPAPATAGVHTVSATDSAAHTGSGSLTTFQPTLAVSPTSAAPGSPLTVSGGAWPGAETIFVQIGSSTFDTDVVCALQSNAAGDISGNQATNNCTVPNVTNGSQLLFAIDEQHPGVIASGTFVVKAGFILTPANAPAGGPTAPSATVSIAGHGFAPSSSVSGFKFDATALTTIPSSVSTDSGGNFTSTVTFTVPAAATAGTHTVSATDSASHTGSASVLLYAPSVTLSPTSAAPGTGVTVSGKGWPPSETVFVQIGSSAFDSDVVCALQSNLSGIISGNQATNNCTVPNVIGGSQPLVAIDEQHQGVVTNGSYTVKPGLVLTPSQGPAGGATSPGVTVTVQGHGFAAGVTVSTFKFDTTALTTTPSTVSTDSAGNFSASVQFTVPASATAKTHTVSATDSSAHTGTGSETIDRATVSLSPSSGPPGTPVTVSGSGWPAANTIFVQVASAAFDTDIVCVLQSNLSGVISGNQASNGCVIPNVPAGSQPIVALDEQQLGVQAFSTDTVKPGLFLTPASGAVGSPGSPGTTVTVQGHGFAANSTVSGFKFDSTALVATPSSVGTDANGNFMSSVTFTIPASATAASHTVSATDLASNKGTAVELIYRPTVAVSPTSGAHGSPLTVSGSGWPAADTVFVQIGSTSFDADIACVLSANLNGDISGNQATNGCAVPSVSTGSQPLVAIDEQNQGVIANGAAFTVTARHGAGRVPPSPTRLT